MASLATINGALTPQLSPDTVLHLRYTELLEKRIAQLESVIDITTKAVTQQNGDISDSTKADNDKVEAENAKTRDLANGAAKSKDVTEIRVEGNQIEGDRTRAETTKIISKSRYRNIIRKFDSKTGIHTDIDVEGLDNKKAEDGEVAFVFRRTVSANAADKNTYSEVDVEAAGLRHLLIECIGSKYPGQNLDGDSVNLITPFAPLVHNWSKLEQAVKPMAEDDEPKKQAREDLEKLLEYIKAAPELEKYFKTRESNLGASITTYETMWTVFPPGTKIVAKLFLNQFQIMQVFLPPIPRNNPTPAELELGAWCWDWNGKEMTKVCYLIGIKKFWGTKSISQLPCYPLEYYKEGDKKEREEFCDNLRSRGKRYNQIVRSKPGASQMYIYEGIALSERRRVIENKGKDTNNDGSSSNSSEEKREKTRRKPIMANGAFLVDPDAFLQFGADYHMLGESEPFWTIGVDNKSADTLRGAGREDREPTPDELLLFPPRLLGYSTKVKVWAQFGVEQTKDVPPRSMSLFKEKLQLDESYKSMIQALVEEHGESGHKKNPDRVKVKDIVNDKGRGLVLLLHGPPGVGKTLTAETIAEATGKPLFVVSVAEIGLDASMAEKNLEQMFYLAGKWEAVLLVDEADVFLESRTSNSDPNRNALVSVLLRVLEYYEGIIILTTNRITSLDIAVQSRIHLAIRYGDFTRHQKINVFEMFLKPLVPESMSSQAYQKVMDYVEEYGSEYDLNGRQIRNVVSSALSLARSLAKDNGGDERMNVDHLKRVLNITKDFQRDLESITMDTRVANEASRSTRSKR